MQTHPYFDLRLHSDDELVDWIGEPLIERVTLHEWPLSCVQRLTGASGQRWIYKTESGPTVEHRFYAQARSPLLPDAKTLHAEDGYVCLLIEYIDATHFEPKGMSEQALLQVGRALVTSIAEIEGDLPAYWVVDSAQWGETAHGMVQKLSTLMRDGTFVSVCPGDITTVRQAGNDKALLACLDLDIGLVHGDLSADNVLVAAGEFTPSKVIDWQYILRGPRLLDLATFLDSLGIDPTPTVGLPIVNLMLLMRIHWLVECATRWFVSGASTYDREIAGMCRRLGELN